MAIQGNLRETHMTGRPLPSGATLRRTLPVALYLSALVLFVLVLIVAPLGAILYHAFVDVQDGQSQITGNYFVTVLTTRIYWLALANTLIVAGGAALVATTVGTLFAWIFVRTNTYGRALLEQVAQLPVFIPPFVGAVAWALLAAPRIGILNELLTDLGLPGTMDVYSRTGMLCVIGLYLAPYVMMIVAGSLRSMDPSLEEAAQIAGLTQLQTARRITAPLLAPSILSGAVLSFTIAVSLFGTPVVLGWAKQILVLTSRIWISDQEVPPSYGIMAVLSIYLLLLSSLSTWLQRAATRGRSYTTITGKGFRPRLLELGPWRVLSLAVAILYLAATVLAPLAVLLAAALSRYTWSGHYAFANLLDTLASDDVWFTLRNSVIISMIAATLATTAGILFSWVVVRTRLRGRGLLEYLVLMPISVPGIAFGVGLMLFWINLPLPVYGTTAIIVIAFVGRFTAYAVRSISASLIQIHPELEECARLCGFGPIRTFLRITFPLIRPSILASWLLLFSFFITELSMVVILYTADSRTFSVLSFEAWNVGDFSRLAAYSLLQLAVGALFMAALKILSYKKSSSPPIRPVTSA